MVVKINVYLGDFTCLGMNSFVVLQKNIEMVSCIFNFYKQTLVYQAMTHSFLKMILQTKIKIHKRAKILEALCEV